MPSLRSLLSRNGLPPVSAAMVARVSCESFCAARCELTVEPVNMPLPREAPLLAPPPGGSPIKLRLIVDAALRYAAGDVDQGLLLGQGAQLFDGLFERQQFLVGIKDVEFG